MLAVNMEKPIKVMCFGRVAKSGGWCNNSNVLGVTLLLVIISGEVTVSVGACQFDLKKYGVIIIPSGTVYSVRTESGFEYYYAHLVCELEELSEDAVRGYISRLNQPSTEALDRIVGDLPRNYESRIIINRVSEPRACFDELLRLLVLVEKLCAERVSGYRHMIHHELNAILLLLYRHTMSVHEFNSSMPQLLFEITDYIRCNIRRRLTLTDISEEYKVSKQYIMKLFRESFGVTATEYINRMKLEYGAKLLRESKMNVSEIAYYLGYSSAHYFGRLFKKQYLCSPSEFAGSL